MALPENLTLQGVVSYTQPDAGYLRIHGPDQQAFLQRQTTNDVGLLASGRSLVTVLTTPTARIVDVLRLIQESEAIGAITLPGYGPETFNFLKSRIFFMDKVTVEDASNEFYQVDLDGPGALGLLSGLGLDRSPALDEVTSGEISGVPVRVIGQRGLSGLGYRLLAPAASAGDVEVALLEGGVKRLNPELHEILRVEAGIPAAGAELVNEYTPLETGLGAVVSGDKGCYTGQEIIARQLTYDKVTQHLVGLRLDAPVQPGDTTWAEGRPAGKVTSCVQSPTFGPIALAILKRPFHEVGIVVAVGEEKGISAVVTALPFRPES